MPGLNTRTIERYGWHPSLPDRRDLAADTQGLTILPEVDPRGEMTPIYDQGGLGSCTANAVAAALDFHRIMLGLEPVFPSRLAIYYFERLLAGLPLSEDTGAYGRDGFKAAAKIGYWPESEWPYSDDVHAPPYDDDPRSALGPADYKLVDDYRAVPRSVRQWKQVLSHRQTIAFGFTVYESFESAEVANTGIVPEPGEDERTLGGHEVLAVGYLRDHPHHVLVRNSWGTGWGMDGYFLMPWSFILDSQMSGDFRTVRRPLVK